MGSLVSIETATYQVLKERLSAEYPTLDEETLGDTLEGITYLHEMIAAIIRSALVDEALQSGLRSRLEDMKQRFARLEDRGMKKRQLALEAMTEVGLKKPRAARLYRLGTLRVSWVGPRLRGSCSRSLLGTSAT